MDLLLDIAKDLANETDNIAFVIIGDGADKERIAGRINDEKITNVILLPFQPYEDIAHVFSLGDIGLIISKPGVGNNSVPSKTWSIMAAGRPVLASFDSDSDLCRLIDKTGCGRHADAGNKEELTNIIKDMYKGDNEDFGEAGLKYLSTDLNKEKCVAQYVSAICER